MLKSVKLLQISFIESSTICEVNYMYMIEGDASLKIINKPVPFLANQSNLFPGFGIS